MMPCKYSLGPMGWLSVTIGWRVRVYTHTHTPFTSALSCTVVVTAHTNLKMMKGKFICYTNPHPKLARDGTKYSVECQLLITVLTGCVGAVLTAPTRHHQRAWHYILPTWEKTEVPSVVFTEPVLFLHFLKKINQVQLKI